MRLQGRPEVKAKAKVEPAWLTNRLEWSHLLKSVRQG